MTVQQNAGYVNIPTIEEMKQAWTHITRSTRTEVKDRLALNIYGHPSHTSKYLSFVLDKLMRSEYIPSNSYPFYRPKKDRSLRRFEFLEMDDRIVFQYLCNRLIRFSYKTIAELYFARRVFGNIPIDPSKQSDWLFLRPFNLRTGGFVVANGQYDLFRNRVLQSYDEFKLKQRSTWLVRTDIRSFYYSVDHEKLLQLIEKHGWLPDEADRNLLRMCLAKWTPGPGKGIPVGYECSDYIGNLYLNRLDESLQDFRVHRYVDDTYILVQDFEEAKNVLSKIDKSLEALGLQRNTSKTKTYRIHDLPRKKLQRMLRESLSTVADERQDTVAERKRQDKLRAILQESFDPKRAAESEDDSFADFRNVAFVLNRITHQEENIVETAYYVLDHDLEHSYHALKYLSNHAPDDRLTKKLKFILEADYEPRSLKALALYCLQKLCDPDVESAIKSIVARNDANDWHLLRSILKQVIEPSLNSFSSELFDSLADYCNPHVEVYARWLIFERAADRSEKGKLVDDMLVNCNNRVKKLGIYLAFRDGFLEQLAPRSLDPHLPKLLPDKILSDIDNFRASFTKVFGFSIPQDFPLEEYFGNMSDTSPIMQAIYSTMNLGAMKFVHSLHTFLEIMLVRIASEARPDADVSNIDMALDVLEDNQLYLLVSTLRGEASKDFAKEGIQAELIARFKHGIETWLGDRLIVEAEENNVRNQVFICYARGDEDWVRLLLDHWQPIEDYYSTLNIWSDMKIESGDHWREEIMNALSKAKTAVLFVSRPFLASRFIKEVELPEILKVEEEQELKVIWIPVSPSNVYVTPIAAFEAAWREPENTLVDMNEPDRDRHLILVTKKIAKEMGLDLSSSTSESSGNSSTE